MGVRIKSEGIFKSKLVKISNCLEKSSDDKMNIVFELINVNDTFFFAKEIITKEIFPTYCFKNSEKSVSSFNSNSYLALGNYFVFVPICGQEEPFKYKVAPVTGPFKKVNSSEVESYIHDFDNEYGNKKMNFIKIAASTNVFECDYQSLKGISYTKNSNISTNTLSFKSKINISEIEKYGYDLSTQSNLCNAIGREEEIKQLIKATCIKNKSVILVGESGCGKTAIVEKMAKDVNENSWLIDKTIFYLNTSSILAGSRYRGVFEDNLNEIINFCIHNKGKIILFIDEMHTLYGLGRGEESSMDAMQILKPYIQSGEIIIIGATTKDEYNEYIMNDPAFCRRFDIIEVPVPDRNLNYQILESFIGELEEKYNISLDIDEVQINNIINYILKITDPMCQKAIDDVKVQNPTLAKNVIEDAFTEAKYNNSEVVTINDIYYAVVNCNRISGINRKETANLLKEIVINSNEKEKIIPFPKTKILG